ncbi:nuclear transport factor 2 family protein [Aliidiomarina indica]|uniref:nuclear transport factor 2 family protein n=1 Tax=Aliidiomarina indica TaxID=2749147 RepID=UPI00188EC3AE|nr:nuclear transport factor 2 family protein [Aliidiomarina indica]
MSNYKDIIRDMYAAFAQGDVPSVLGVLAPDVHWIEAEGGPQGGTYVGPQAVLENVFMKLGTDWEIFEAVPAEIIADQNTVVALGEYSGTHHATGKSFKAPFAHVWKFRDGKAIFFQQYTDTLVMQRAT